MTLIDARKIGGACRCCRHSGRLLETQAHQSAPPRSYRRSESHLGMNLSHRLLECLFRKLIALPDIPGTLFRCRIGHCGSDRFRERSHGVIQHPPSRTRITTPNWKLARADSGTISTAFEKAAMAGSRKPCRRSRSPSRKRSGAAAAGRTRQDGPAPPRSCPATLPCGASRLLCRDDRTAGARQARGCTPAGASLTARSPRRRSLGSSPARR